MSFQIDISNTDGFKSEILTTAGVLQVIECYQDWCGPCKSISSTFKRLYFDFSDRPLKFYTVNLDKVHIQGADQYKGKCQPVFMFYKDGKVVEVVQGVQALALIKLVTSLSEVKAV